MPPSAGRKAGEDHARSQCPEEHPGTHCCLRQEARPTSSGSEARWREEVMLEKSSQEVMPLRTKQYIPSCLTKNEEQVLALITAQNNIVRQRSTVHRPEKKQFQVHLLSVASRRNSCPLLVIGDPSFIKTHSPDCDQDQVRMTK